MTLTMLDLAIVGAITIGALLVVATSLRKEPVVAPPHDPSSKEQLQGGVFQSIKDEIDEYVLESIERFTRPTNEKGTAHGVPRSVESNVAGFDPDTLPTHYIPAYEIAQDPRYHFGRADVIALMNNKKFYGITPRYLVRTGNYIAFRRETFEEWYEKFGKKLRPAKDEKQRKKAKAKGK